ncbi:ABC-type histidine transport system ATPase subunit [Desulfosalsimonas propionicica]|uniref:ABC-type histidine transport system ATPase subunit n=1 Tax=Desulfosalsimonas propionicica TaxID=332175 RepID=A0A7W0HL01_9BACT|nr:hypothetical protein [Desulfosalsimonas propionicica]MBA2881794.1 ABC-type histidine transport system ATPase subunit [Desulfosalsimonas propionicica]
MSQSSDQQQLDRIEKKLDMIIEHFNIGASSQAKRSSREIDDIVRSKIYHLQNRQRRAKK